MQDIQSTITNKIVSDLATQIDNLIIEGLKRKGFEFDNNLKLENFIKTRCKLEDNIKFKERIYYANNIPFLLHKYEIIYEPITQDNNGIKMSANYGSYTFL